MLPIKEFISAFIFMIVVDYVWLAVAAKQFYLTNLKPVLRLNSEGGMQPIIFPALLVYVALAIGLVYFVVPKSNGSAIAALGIGAIMGLVVYSVYELTNYSLLSGWSLKIVFVDILWGIFLAATTSYLLVKIFG